MNENRKSLIFGVGINDSDDKIYNKVDGKNIICLFYSRWRGMLERCYSLKLKIKHPTYDYCECVPEWIYFSNFKAWMEKQDWENKQLDKDILFPGNKIYGPETCIFIDQKVNKFVTDRKLGRGEWPIGVHFHKPLKLFLAQCNSVETGKRIYLGCYDTPEEAHLAWLSFKLEQAHILAAEQKDPRVAQALISRYENYTQNEEIIF